MAELEKVDARRYRIHCDCGKFAHELIRREDGEVVLETFGKRVKEEKENVPAPAPKKKTVVGFFEED